MNESEPPQIPVPKPARPLWIKLGVGATIVGWGFTFVFLKRLTNPAHSSHPLSPAGFLALRFLPLLPLLVLLGFSALRREPRAHLRRDWPWIAFMGLLVIPGYHLPMNLAMRTPIHTGLMALILSLSPLATYALARLIGQEQRDPRRKLGISVALLGLAGVFAEELWKTYQASGAISFSWEGVLWVALSVLSWTIYTLVGRRLAGAHDPLFVFALSGVFGTLAVAALSAGALCASDFEAFRALDWGDWAAWAYVSLFSSFFAYWAWLVALTRYEASRLAVTGNLVPLLAHAAAALFLPMEREAYTLPYLVGAGLTLGGVVLVNVRKH